MSDNTMTTYTIPSELMDTIFASIANGVREGIVEAAAASKPKIGPTPYTTFRWYIDSAEMDNFLVIEPIGCPKHEEKETT